MKMTEEEVKDLLVKTNAIMNGHFLLTSGLHSPHYVEKFNVLQHPKYTQQLCEAMAEKFGNKLFIPVLAVPVITALCAIAGAAMAAVPRPAPAAVRN